MNIEKHAETAMNDIINDTIKGVKVKILPKVGHACYEDSGSDTYGYVISNVAEDYTWFEYSDKDGQVIGYAALITGKNRNGRGLYTRATTNGKRWIPQKIDTVHARCSSFGVIYPTDEVGCGETKLDPSF